MENILCHEDIEQDFLTLEDSEISCEVNGMNRLMNFLDDLESEELRFKLRKLKDCISVEVPLKNERWEVKFMYEGTVEIERFINSGIKYDETAFNLLFTARR